MSSSSTPRASSRSAKRSTTNLSNLRLAPLSTRFADQTLQPRNVLPRSPYDEASEMVYARHHPTYMQGRSAPSTPGILSRSSSRRHLGGGLSRRGSLYDDAPEYPTRDEEMSANQGDDTTLPKAKSEAALASRERLSGQGVPLRKGHTMPPRSKTGGSNTPRARARARRPSDEDWLSRASAATNTLLQESKGQTWLSTRDSSASLVIDASDDDEGYEEMAALSASTIRLPRATEDALLHSSLTRQHKWGSRFGSRSASRRTSRRGSFSRTPALSSETMGSYFDTGSPVLTSTEIAEEPENSSSDSELNESELAELARNQSMGFGGIVDRLMGFSIFGGTESEESGAETGNEASGTTQQRKRVQIRDAPPPPSAGEEGERVGIWEDTAWLLSIAGRALT